MQIPEQYLVAAERTGAWCLDSWQRIRKSKSLSRLSVPNAISLRVGRDGASAGRFTLVVCFESERDVPPNLQSLFPWVPESLRIVVRYGLCRALNGSGRFRPAVPGLSIGVNCRGADSAFPSGTLGAVVTKAGRPGERFLLSANHVIALNGAFDNDESRKVLQPPRHFDEHPAPADVVAVVEEIDPICMLGVGENIGDWAIARIVSDARPAFPAGIPALSPAGPIDALDAVNAIVLKAGAATDVRRGIVSAPKTTLQVPYAAFGSMVSFKDQLSVDDLPGEPPFAEPGDSGSLAVTEDGRVVGLVYADSPTGTVVCPLKPLFDRLGLSIAT